MKPTLTDARWTRRTLLGGLVAAGGLAAAPWSASARAAARRTPDVIYVPTPQRVVDRMLELCKPVAGDVLYDLGCGDGRIPITAAQRYGIPGVGIDIDPQRIKEANQNAAEAQVVEKVRFLEADLFESDFSAASIVTLYLLPSLNVKLRPQLFTQLRPGTRITSHAFDMADWQPDHFETVDGAEIYFWVLPATVAGDWAVQGPEGRSFTLVLRQQFQQVTGAASDGQAIDALSLRGTALSLTLGGTALGATVEGETLRFDQPGWSARRTRAGEIEGVRPA